VQLSESCMEAKITSSIDLAVTHSAEYPTMWGMLRSPLPRLFRVSKRATTIGR
jgi:hypothetical protein